MNEFPTTPSTQPEPDEKKEKVVSTKEVVVPDRIRIRLPEDEED